MNHVETKRYLRGFTKVSEFDEFLEDIILSDHERRLLELFYLRKYPLDYIADDLGFSYSYIRKLHSQALHKVGTYLERL